MEDTEFYTATMAKVYADQGHTEKAIEIYKFILDRDPERSDIREALESLETEGHEESVMDKNCWNCSRNGSH